MCPASIVIAYGESISRFRLRTHTLIFCSCDFFSLVLQAAGSGMTSNAKMPSILQTAINVMLTGLSCQVISFFIFSVVALEYAYPVNRNPRSWDTTHAVLYENKLFQAFLCSLAFATLAIFTRSIFRVAELSGGFNGSLANNRISFMILEGAMVTIPCSCLTLWHPGIVFQGHWANANFKFRKGSREGIEGTTPANSGANQEQDGVYQSGALREDSSS